ncbi:HPP family protein [Thaumasiovibrio subtropicus]|uniref:HPP family protein n=1 Tax=Thaumasiovibrio subtropicus TaxID=1891207 RepID=UPI000B351393|nr:HPP family protein [Thaumasiovibrio subtropicus]
MKTALEMLKGFCGGSLGIGSLYWIGHWLETPLLIAPFGASCVLLFAAATSPLAQPRNVIGGHVIAAIIGLSMLMIFGDNSIAMVLSVGVAIAAMQGLKVIHPPAGATPLVIFMSHAETTILIPALFGSLLLVIIALAFHRLLYRAAWPVFWFKAPE